MPHIKALVSLPHVNGIAQDVVVNTFHFQTLSGDQTTALEEIMDELEAFYISPVATAGSPLKEWLSSTLETQGSTIKLYLMSDLIPRPVIAQRTFNLGVVSTLTLPREVALCMSFQAVKLAGFPQSRRRGRVYLGPFGEQASSFTLGDARPAGTLINVVKGIGSRLSSALEFSTWSIFSPTTGALLPVNDGWVDNSFDTQRRRGLDPSVRNTWS
jgi:hypothetical protein